jgi:hypothetical protein
MDTVKRLSPHFLAKNTYRRGGAATCRGNGRADHYAEWCPCVRLCQHGRVSPEQGNQCVAALAGAGGTRGQTGECAVAGVGQGRAGQVAVR